MRNGHFLLPVNSYAKRVFDQRDTRCRRSKAHAVWVLVVFWSVSFVVNREGESGEMELAQKNKNRRKNV